MAVGQHALKRSAGSGRAEEPLLRRTAAIERKNKRIKKRISATDAPPREKDGRIRSRRNSLCGRKMHGAGEGIRTPTP